MATTRRPAQPKHADSTDTATSADAVEVRVLKKYPNRRLYDTTASSYITLADVKKMVMSGESFVVRDAKTAEDLTRSILLQIIRFYGHSMQGMMGSYLEKNLQTFTEIQGRLADPALGLYDTAGHTPELWSQFLNGQAPAVQGLMSTYLEQSKSMFTQMQEQMAKQAGTLFPGVPSFPPKR